MSPRPSLFDEYAKILAALIGDEFQEEVCARLGGAILGFQTIPARPQGDGGLDGYSHDGHQGYCCYGLQPDAFKQNRSREKAIVDKFSDDLLRVLELEKNRGKLAHAENVALQAILGPGCRLVQITLIVNWFDSHKVLAPLRHNFNTYKAVSRCNFVEPTALIVVVGPKELANRHAIDELTIARAQQRSFIRLVQEKADLITIDNPKDFDWKMQLLREIRPDQVAGIDKMSEAFRVAWRMALAFEQQLDESAPNLHRVFETNRQQIVGRIAALMLSSSQPWTQLGQAATVAEQILQLTFKTLYNDILPQLSSGEIARLIGECPITWEKPSQRADA